VARGVLVETGGVVVYTPGRDNLEAVKGASKPNRKRTNGQSNQVGESAATSRLAANDVKV